MTPLLQPADVSWMRPLKVAYFKKWNHWLVHAPKAYTASGNVKSPGYATVITWISEIEIARSFDHCGITSKNSADYDSLLGHFVRTNQLVVEIMPIDQVLADTTGELDDQRDDSRYRLKKPKLTVRDWIKIYFWTLDTPMDFLSLWSGVGLISFS